MRSMKFLVNLYRAYHKILSKVLNLYCRQDFLPFDGLMNLYITGLNQITDVEIDKVNKPNLPIPAGHLSPKRATIVVITSLILSLGIGIAHPASSNGLNTALWASMILGTMYSLPPIRLKRFPVFAAFCIVAVRGAVINAGFFAHAKAVAYAHSGVATSVLTCLGEAKCFLSCLFFAAFGVVIGMFMHQMNFLLHRCFIEYGLFPRQFHSLHYHTIFDRNKWWRCYQNCSTSNVSA